MLAMRARLRRTTLVGIATAIVALSLATVAAASGGPSPTPGVPSQQQYTENLPTPASRSSDGGGPLVPVLGGLGGAAALAIAGGASWRLKRRATAQ